MIRVSAKTANKHLKILRMVWKSAEKEGVLKENIFQRVDLAKAEQSTRRGFSEQELETLLNNAEGEMRGLILFGLYTGQRLGDLASLTWRNIDLVENEIRLTTHKTYRHMVLPIMKPLADYLAALPATDNPDSPLFPEAFESVERIGNVNTISHQFTSLLKDCGIKAGT